MRRVARMTALILVCGGLALGAYAHWHSHHRGDAPRGDLDQPEPSLDPRALLAAFPQEEALRGGIPPHIPLPWEEDADFQAAAQANGTPVRMAAFRAVLTEPYESELENIALAAQKLAGSVLLPGETFSQNQTLGPYTEERGYLPGPNYVGGRVIIDAGGGVCKISTFLYNLTVLSDLKVVSRRAHSMIVPYVPPGQDATVTYTGGVDFRFANDTAGPIMIWSRLEGETLYMAFYGSSAAPRVEWGHETLSRTPATTEVRYNADLEPGEERVVFEGFDGYAVRSWATVTTPDGEVTRRDLGVSHYRMAPRVVERGPV